MPLPKLTRLELRIMETLWSKGRRPSAIAGSVPGAGSSGVYDGADQSFTGLNSKKAVRRASQGQQTRMFSRPWFQRSSAQHGMTTTWWAAVRREAAADYGAPDRIRDG